MWLGVSANPTAEWIARQVTEACGWEAAPGHMIRDRDSAYGAAYLRHEPIIIEAARNGV